MLEIVVKPDPGTWALSIINSPSQFIGWFGLRAQKQISFHMKFNQNIISRILPHVFKLQIGIKHMGTN